MLKKKKRVVIFFMNSPGRISQIKVDRVSKVTTVVPAVNRRVVHVQVEGSTSSRRSEQHPGEAQQRADHESVSPRHLWANSPQAHFDGKRGGGEKVAKNGVRLALLKEFVDPKKKKKTTTASPRFGSKQSTRTRVVNAASALVGAPNSRLFVTELQDPRLLGFL